MGRAFTPTHDKLKYTQKGQCACWKHLRFVCAVVGVSYCLEMKRTNKTEGATHRWKYSGWIRLQLQVEHLQNSGKQVVKMIHYWWALLLLAASVEGPGVVHAGSLSHRHLSSFTVLIFQTYAWKVAGARRWSCCSHGADTTTTDATASLQAGAKRQSVATQTDDRCLFYL